MAQYILAIDQSTQGTKALIIDQNGDIVCRKTKEHRQIITPEGWIEHDPIEIYENLLTMVRDILLAQKIAPKDIRVIGLCNQRETTLAWDKNTGEPLYNAIVWQCDRAQIITQKIIDQGYAAYIKKVTGIPASPYYSAAKMTWFFENVEEINIKAKNNEVCFSTMDSWLLFQMLGGTPKTDYSNAARTQLFNINELKWDEELCDIFNVPINSLPELCPSNDLFGYTDLAGIFPEPIPIHSVMGDSNGAMYAQGCHKFGMVKATYGTGSSVMMNIGNKPIFNEEGVVTSIGWFVDNKPTYVLEGNINYTGAVTQWLVDDLKILEKASLAGTVAGRARDIEGLYLIPAFSGLGAPYWKNNVRAMICGMDRNTGNAEIVRAGEECIAYQITDIISIMEKEIQQRIEHLRVDGGPTKDKFLMQFQSDITDSDVRVAQIEELSGSGVGFMAGIAVNLLDENTIFNKKPAAVYRSSMADHLRTKKIKGWKSALEMLING
ncbi:MAG TPA: glycerol kinase GlpK [Clostridiaceae bacterium]|nr:glycerol kinase GlpK [Clostridiaceae bacterium]